jgi:hypothetical protein
LVPGHFILALYRLFSFFSMTGASYQQQMEFFFDEEGVTIEEEEEEEEEGDAALREE